MINSVTSYTQIHCESRRSLVADYKLFIQTESYFRISFYWNTTLFQWVIRPHVSGQCSLLRRSIGPTDFWKKSSPTPQRNHQVSYFIFLMAGTLPVPVAARSKADAHIACHAHAVPLPCHAAKGLECVLPIWLTQCGRVWFTLAMPCSWPCRFSQGHGTARPSRDGLWATCPRSASSGYQAEFHEDCYQKPTNPPHNYPYLRL
jgi:hypothetical protein